LPVAEAPAEEAAPAEAEAPAEEAAPAEAEAQAEEVAVPVAEAIKKAKRSSKKKTKR